MLQPGSLLRLACVLGLAFALAAIGKASTAADRFFLREGDRVLLLGDSITHAGGYTQYLEAYLITRFPERRVELINLGLGSEGVTGLTEPDHPFPRPNVHDRLTRALHVVKPSVVVACYGMNDGIYHPFSPERMQKYQQGIRALVSAVKGSGARLALVTPPPFDPTPVKSTVGADAPEFGYKTPYRDYDEVLTRYSAWLLTLRKEGLTVVDIHTPLLRHLREERKSNPGYLLAPDGVHLNAAGHALFARELLRAWGAPEEVDRAEIDARALRVRQGDVNGLTRDGDGLRFRWRTRVPLPAEVPLAPLNRHVLRVTRGDEAFRYALYEGDEEVARLTQEELARGIDLTAYPELSTNRRAAELFAKIQERERLLSSAWLSHVGHTRPQTPAGSPLEEARRRAAPLTAEIERLTRPVELELRLERRR
ncbi:MAG: SGNH/GDSL hydrolase family protein [Armatimonadota bacterium]